MKGLTLEQLNEVINFAQKHHKFALWKTDEEREETKRNFPSIHSPAHGMNIKYIDFTYDSRDATFWVIKFRQVTNGVAFSTNHFSSMLPVPKGWKYDNLYDLCMAYLKGEFKPKEEFYIK